MTDKNIQAIIDKRVAELEELKRLEKMQYVMDFGDLVIQYEFCLN